MWKLKKTNLLGYKEKAYNCLTFEKLKKKVTPDGREVKTLITSEGLTKLTQSQTDTKTSKHSAVITRELKENKLIEVKKIF